MMGPRLAIVAMLGAVAIYGATFPLSRHATQNGLTPHDITVLRFGTAGLILLPYFLRQGWRDCAGLGWGRGFLLACMSGVPMVLLMNTGLRLAPAAHGASIQPGMVTVIGAVGSILLFNAVPTRIAVVGIAITIIGLACIGIAGTTSGSPGMLQGDLLFLMAGSLWGLYPLMLQRWRVAPMVGTAVVAVLSLAYLPVYAAFMEPRIFAVDPGFVAFHALLQGVLNIVLALWLWGTAVRVLGAATAQRFPPLIPVVGTLSAIPILGEWPGPLQTLGVGLIVSGLMLAAFGNRIFRRPPAEATRP
ncbi:MAG TPA: DMT family transporter [Microvirga sp.]|jgi:drug/metabolite transporter (DMT)-like permease|nr:DMT family transporter [Microvirga sp.]